MMALPLPGSPAHGPGLEDPRGAAELWAEAGAQPPRFGQLRRCPLRGLPEALPSRL